MYIIEEVVGYILKTLALWACERLPFLGIIYFVPTRISLMEEKKSILNKALYEQSLSLMGGNIAREVIQ